MGVNELDTTPKVKSNGIYNTEPYHLEKYVVPGAVAVALLLILPSYLLVGRALGSVDLGSAIIAVLVIGHVIESMKLYQWGRKVRDNFKTFNAKVQGLLSADDIKEDKLERAKAILFSLLKPSEISEFAWNLVRWQKMSIFAVLLCLSAVQWLLFSLLAIAEWCGYNPFRASFKLSVLKSTAPLWWSLIGELVLVVIMIVAAFFVYKYARDRQNRTNGFYFQLFQNYREVIVGQLKK